MVFVADGAGNYQCASRAFRQAAGEGRIPVQVVTFEWSHGYLRSLADLMDYRYAREQGRKLAELVQDYRRHYPNKPVYLAGHSAGALVVLTALEHLPPESVDRAVLISASISAFYDLRPALGGVKYGLHNFHSERDWIYCGLFTRLFGNSDRNHFLCAGRAGFRTIPQEPELAGKLVERPWTCADQASGNTGGHFGHYQPSFLRMNILPLLHGN